MTEHPHRNATDESPQELPGFFGSGSLLPKDEIDPGIWARIDEFVDRNPGGQERLIPLLHMVQEILGYLPYPVQEYVAGKLGMSPIQVFGVVSFYHFFTTTPRGRYQLKVCMGTACFVRHSQHLIETIGSVLDLKLGEVTEDRLFSLEQVRCIGACGLAPAMMVNNEVHGHLSPKGVRKLITKLRSQARTERKKDTEDSAEAPIE
jgi:NADH:ubiquinone oxidoreductase subunit E